ncbi:MAG: right-handed parallel beta-helix repeat-containing protein [Proteobacteria bacterium]|nr:right-handed parallel beta-helix repeat-containing protein [Pseudomonadota bacterium]
MRTCILKLGSCLALSAFLISCGESEIPPPILSFAETFQTQLIEAQPGDIIEVPAGVHEFTRSLSLNVSGVTIRGAGMDASILSFRNQIQGAEGLLVTADDFVIEDLAIEDTVGDALKINGSTNVTIRRVRTEWTDGPKTENGAYGIYPVQSTNVLIDGSVAIGASDAGIYVGQSTQIIVRNSRAEYNVAGIEIENSSFADVYDNVVTNNTGGVLVFDLPNLPVQGGQATRVFRNKIYGNNTENFATKGSAVSRVAAGTGLLVLANDNIEIFENQFTDNNNVNVMIYSYVLGGRTFSDPNYDPYPEKIYLHDNVFIGGGTVPRHEALIALHQETGNNTPNIVWDGLLREGASNDPVVCLANNGEESFVNLNGGDASVPPSFDTAMHQCSLPRLSEIKFDFPGG